MKPFSLFSNKAAKACLALLAATLLLSATEVRAQYYEPYFGYLPFTPFQECLLLRQDKAKVKSLEKYEYPVEERFGKLEKSGDPYGHHVYEYNRSGTALIKGQYFYYKESTEIPYHYVVYNYNESGRWTGEDRFHMNNSISGRTILNYSNENNTVHENRYFSDGKLYYKCIYTYDGDGRIIDWKKYDSSSKLRQQIKYFYDKSGKLERMEVENSDGYDGLSGNCYFYHTDNRLSRIVDEVGYVCEDGIMGIGEYIYEYYDNGDMKSDCFKKSEHNDNCYDSDMKIIYSYKYDDNGNWIERTTYRQESENHLPVAESITVREITYWE